jgi:hypothetical protein
MLVSIVVGGAFSVYFYFYTVDHRTYLEQRNYRVLATVARQIGSRIEGLATVWRSIGDGCRHEDACIDEELKLIPGLVRVDCPATSDGDGEGDDRGASSAWLGADNDLRLRSSQGRLCARLAIGEVARTSLAETFFDDYIVTDENGKILFRQQELWKDAALEDVPLPTPTAAATPGSAPAKFAAREPQLRRHAGREYLRFSQPMRVALDDVTFSWWVHGQVPTRLFQRQVWQISPTILSALVVGIATLLLGWPIFKLWLLGPREMFQRIDVYALALSFLFGAGLLAAFGLDTYAYRALAAERFDGGLRELAAQIAANFYDEVRRGQAILSEFAQEGVSGLSPAERRPAVAATKLRAYPYASLYHADGRGKISARWNVHAAPGGEPELHEVAAAAQVADRRYFRHAQEGRLFWRFAAEKGFAAEVVRSRLDGQITFVLALPTAESAHRPVEDREVAFISLPLISLIDAVMPFGFGFAVVDPSGDVIVHRQHERSGLEKIIEECEDDTRLAAALETQRELLLNVRYYGRPHRFYVRPLENTPWSLIVFRTREPLQTANAAIFQVTVALFAIYLAVPALFLAALQAERRYRGEWLWPRRDYADLYALGSAALLFAVVVLFATIDYAHAWARFLLLAAVPALCWCFLVLLLAPPAAARRRAVVFAGLAASGMGVVAAAWMSHTPRRSAAWAVAVVVVCVVIAVIAQRRRGAAGQRDERVFRAAYASLLTLACVAVSVGPATLLFRDAFDQGLTGFVRYGQFRHLQALTERADRVYRSYQEKRLVSGSPRDRLEQDLDVYQVPLYGTAPDSGGGSVRPQRAAQEPTPYLAQSIFPWLPSYQRAVGRIGLLVRSVADGDALATWRSEPAGGSRSLQLEITDDALQDRLRDVAPGLLALRAEPFELLPATLGGRLRFFLAWAVGIGALGALAGAIARRVFLLDADVGLAMRPDPAGGAAVLPTWVAVRQAPQSGKGMRTVDLSALRQPADCAALFRDDPAPPAGAEDDGKKAAPIDRTPGLVLLAHLETRAGDRQWTSEKLALIERLLFQAPFADRVSVVLLSQASPMQLWARQSKAPGAAAGGSTSAEEAAVARRWAELMRSFSSAWVSLPQSKGYFARLFGAARGVAVATASQPFAEAWASVSSYHDVWSTSSAEEKLALVHLAGEGFLNPAMLGPVTSLIERGVLVREPALRFVDPDFAKFVAAAKDDAALEDWRKASPRGEWERLRAPGLVLLAAAIAFLFATQRGVWDSTSALMAAVSAGVPTVLKFLGLFTSKNGTTTPSGGAS